MTNPLSSDQNYITMSRHTRYPHFCVIIVGERMLQLMGGWEPDPPALHVRRDVSIQLHVGIFINETWHGLSGRAQLGTAWLARLGTETCTAWRG